MVGGCRRFGRRRKNEWGGRSRRRRLWFVAGRYDLVLFRTPLREPCIKAPLPHLIGARLLRAPDAGCFLAIRNERPRRRQIHSCPQHPGATAGGQFWLTRPSILLL